MLQSEVRLKYFQNYISQTSAQFFIWKWKEYGTAPNLLTISNPLKLTVRAAMNITVTTGLSAVEATRKPLLKAVC